MTASNLSLDTLADLTAVTTMRAAGQYFGTIGYDVSDYAAASAVVKRHAKEALPAALADAKEALDAGMTEAAIATLTASMRIAGIKAAKEIAGR